MVWVCFIFIEVSSMFSLTCEQVISQSNIDYKISDVVNPYHMKSFTMHRFTTEYRI